MLLLFFPSFLFVPLLLLILFHFPLWLNKAPCRAEPQSRPPDPSAALWRGDFMSELLIITGDCILTFSPEIHKRKAQRPTLGRAPGSFPPPAGNALPLRGQGELFCICFASLYLCLRLVCFPYPSESKLQSLIVRGGR